MKKTISAKSGSARPEQEDPKAKGRQRSPESEAAVLGATAELMKTTPLRDLTIEQIARRAGVGKATIYRWWSSKAAVALDAYLKLMARDVAIPNTGSFLQDITLQLQSVTRFYKSKEGSAFRQFLAEAQSDPQFQQIFLDRFLSPHRVTIRSIWDRGVDRGEIVPDVDIDMAMDIVYGPMIFRLLAGHGELNDDEAAQLAYAAYRSVGLEPFAKRPARSKDKTRSVRR
jgi:AcrR family transcriptional regulator